MSKSRHARLSLGHLLGTGLVLGALAVSAALAQAPVSSGGAGQIRSGDADAQASPAAAYFTDTLVIDQNGQEKRFYSDLLQGKVVVVNTIFTTCTGICPVMGKTFARVQDHLGDRLGKDVRLISISVDPENDTPEKLREFAARFGGRPGWYLITGRKENVEFILHKLGQSVDAKEDHKALLLVGNEPTGLWKKVFALANPDEIIGIIDGVIQDEAGTAVPQ